KRTRTRCRVVRQAKSPPSPPPLSAFYPSPPSPQTPPSSERGNEIQPVFCEARVVLGRVGSRSASAVGRRQSLARPGSDRGNSGFPMCKTGKTRCRVGWSSEVRREADKEEKVEKEKEEEEREDEEQEEQEVEVGGEVEEEDEEEDEEEGEKEEREEEDLVVDGFQRLATVSRNCVFAGRLARVQEASTGSELSQLVVSPEGDTKYLAATATRMTGEGDGEDDEFVYSNLLTGKYQITFQGLYPLLLTLFMDTPKTLKTLPPSQSALPPGSISSMPRIQENGPSCPPNILATVMRPLCKLLSQVFLSAGPHTTEGRQLRWLDGHNR
ncbi:unnamed protein product, partial [Protopolystoma xenopodis]